MSVIVWACRGCSATTSLRRKNGKPCPKCSCFWSQVQRRESDKEFPDGEHLQAEDGEMISLADAQEDVEDFPRIMIGGKFAAVDTLLGGGIVGDSTILISGPPGIGKSTFVLQVLQELAKKERVLYVSAEESVRQVGGRSKRLGKFNRKLMIVHQTDLDEILDVVDEYRPSIVVVDSIQMIGCSSPYTGEDLQPGSVSGVAQATKTINDFAKKESVAFFIVGHVDKGNEIAGPASGLMHKVDAIIFFNGEKNKIERTLLPHKNRHGSAGPEVVVHMEMREKGLVVVGSPEERAASKKLAEEAQERAKKVTVEAAAKAAAKAKVDDKKVVPTAPATKKKPLLRSVPLSPEPDASQKPNMAEKAAANAREWKRRADEKREASASVKAVRIDAVKTWSSSDGVPAAVVLLVPCGVDGCRGTIDRACSAGAGAREAGFHESRVQLARDSKPMRAARTKMQAKLRTTIDERVKSKPKQKPKKKTKPEART